MKTIEKLLNSTKDISVGNYRADVYTGYIDNHLKRNISLYGIVIGRIDDTAKVFTVDSSYGTLTTIKACNQIAKQLIEKGYTEKTES